jgi:hypothetical protein
MRRRSPFGDIWGESRLEGSRMALTREVWRSCEDPRPTSSRARTLLITSLDKAGLDAKVAEVRIEVK